MTKALVLQLCRGTCSPIISKLTQGNIDCVFIENSVDAIKLLLEEKFEFIVICTDLAQDALAAVQKLKYNSAIPISTHVFIFSRNVKRNHLDKAFSLGITKFYDVDDTLDYDLHFSEQASSNPSQILLVEDNQAIAEVLIHSLESHDHVVTHKKSATAAQNSLLKQSFDLLITDLLLDGNKTGHDLISYLQRQRLLEHQLPAVVITGYGDPAVKIELLHQGVSDVIVKPIIAEELLLRVERVLKIKHYQSQLELQSQQLLSMSVTDALTGVFNRRFMDEALAQRMNSLDRKSEPFSVLMIDIDDFKLINDQFGHLEGDKILKLVATLVQEEIRNIDSLCRYGGEEFLLILSDCGLKRGLAKAQELCDKIANKSSVTVSIGVAAFENYSSELTVEKIVKKADDLMYQAKKEGRIKSVNLPLFKCDF